MTFRFFPFLLLPCLMGFCNLNKQISASIYSAGEMTKSCNVCSIEWMVLYTTWIGFWIWIWSTRHCGLGQEVACSFQCWKNSTCFVWLGLTDANNVKMKESVLEEKPFFKMLGLTFSSKLDCGSYIISIAKLPPRKLEP